MIGFAAKVNTGLGVSPAIVSFEVTVESLRLAIYSEDEER